MRGKALWGSFYAMCSIVFCKDNATRAAVVYFKKTKKNQKRKEKQIKKTPPKKITRNLTDK